MLAFSGASNATSASSASTAQAQDLQVEQLSELFKAARKLDPTSQAELANTLEAILDRPVELGEAQKEIRASYLVQLIEAYYRLFPCCLVDEEPQLLKRSLHQTVQRLGQMPSTIIEEEYSRLNRNSYNQPLKELVLRFSRPSMRWTESEPLPALTESECLLALFLQCLRQQLGAAVLLSDRFQVEYRDLIKSACLAAKEPEVCQTNLIGWLWEAMKSFDPLKAFSASGHGRPTFEAWVRTVVSNKLADEKRKLLKREADELLFYEPRAGQIFQDRYQVLPAAVQAEIDLQACLRLITIVQKEVTSPRIRATTSRLRHQVSLLLNWSIDQTRDVHQQVRRILGRYVQSTRSLNITSADSNQEWIDNYPDTRTLANPTVQALDCIAEFLNDTGTPAWVQDWCEKRRTQAEIARELYVSQPTISRCLGREYRLWLYRRFFLDGQTPTWMKRWYDTQNIQSPHQRRQLRREIYAEYAQGLYSAKSIDAKIETMLGEWCNRNGIYYLP
ncbi:MAG TPA: hypothetical protein V6D03_07785 [Candidatus Caenarcaniphilales bacterium]